MKSVAAIVLAVTAWGAAAVLGVPPAASADQLINLRANQDTVQSRLDELARPAPQTGAQPGISAATAPDPGSFPRSFLIPGTDTSIRIGGSVDGTMGYSSH